MSSTYLKCPYCNRDNFESARGLTQHQNRSKPCNIAMMESFGLTKKRRIIAHDYVPVMSTNNAKSHNILCAGPLAADVQIMKSQQSDGESAQSDGWVMDQNSFSSEQSSDSSVASVDEINDDIDRTMRNNYNEYLVYAQRNFIDFAHTESIAIKLLWKLRQTTASLSTYEDVMDWHLRANGSLQPHESAGESLEHMSAQKMHRKLQTRCNIARDKCHLDTRIALPSDRLQRVPSKRSHAAANLCVAFLYVGCCTLLDAEYICAAVAFTMR